MNSTPRYLVVIVAQALLVFSPCSPCHGQSWRFAVVGDSRGADNGVDATILSELATEISHLDVDLLLFTGDLVEGSKDLSILESQLLNWRDIMQPVYSAGIDIYPVRGNHENDRTRAAWDNVFSGEYLLPQNGPTDEQNLTYAVSHKNSLILGLDHYATRHRVNQAWLDHQLAIAGQPHVIAFGHEPAFSVDHADTLDDHVEDRDRFWDSLVDAGGRAYFAGHDHFYNHARIDDDGDAANDIHQFVVGTAGAPLRNWDGKYDGSNSEYSIEQVEHSKRYGYMLGEIDGLSARLTWMERSARDQFEPGDEWSYTVVPESHSNAICLPCLAICYALKRRSRRCGARRLSGHDHGDDDSRGRRS